MQGLVTLIPTNEIVGKKSEYTKEEFVKTIKEEEDKDVAIDSVREGYMRYYPKGTEDSWHEFGRREGVYLTIDKLTKGAFEVWIA